MDRKKAITLAGVGLGVTVVILTAVLHLTGEHPILDPLIYYKNARHLCQDRTVQMKLDTTTRTQIGNEEFTERAQQTATLYYENGTFTAGTSEESLTSGSQTTSLTQSYQDGALYMDLDSSSFTATMTAADYLSRLPPAVMFDEVLYSSILGTQIKEVTTISFSKASSAETWATPADAQFLSASGTVRLSKDSRIQESTYQVQYTVGAQTVEKTVTAVYYWYDLGRTPPHIEETDKYTHISDPDAPLLLERMSGLILQAENISGNYTEYIFCEAFGDTRTRSIDLQMSQGDSFAAQISTAVSLTNSSRAENNAQRQQLEIFENGVYSLSVDGEFIQPEAPFTEESLRSYCRDLLVGTILLPQHITAVTTEKIDGTVMLRFSANQDLAALISTDACRTLYQDPSVLNSIASNRFTDIMECYLQIDPATGLPLSSGIHYSGTYTISTLSYKLAFQAEQAYQFSSAAA